MRLWRLLSTLPLRIRALVRRNQVEQELDDEFRDHLERRIEADVARGMTASDARYAALRALGGIEQRKEECRDMRGNQVFDQFRQDVRYAWRSVAKSPGFTSITLLSLTLGIGANTAIFSLINALVIRPLPGIDQPERLVRLTNGSFSYAMFQELNRQRMFANAVAFSERRTPAEVNGSMQWTQVELVSGDYFTALGVRAALGRTLSPGDERTQAPVAVLSHRFWTRGFSSDPGVLGQTVRVNGLPVTIVGVTAPEFGGVVVGSPTDITVPLTLAPRIWAELRSDVLTRRSARWVSVLARLTPGESLEQANARLQVVWPRVLSAAAPAGSLPTSSFFAHRTQLRPAGNGFSQFRGPYVSPLYVLMVLVGLVLLIACANVANLLLARGAAREREFAIRLAAGASRSRVIRQLLTESALLAMVAALGGAILATWGTHLLVRFISSSRQPVFLDLGPDWRVLLFTIVVTGLTVLLFGLAPALRSVRVDVAASLKEHARSIGGAGTRLRRGLLVAQVALSMLLAVGAGLFIGSLRQVLAVDTGIDATNVLLVRADATDAGYRGERIAQFFTELLDRVNALPDVQSAAMSWVPPVSQGTVNSGDVSVEGFVARAGDDRLALSNFVSPRYFETVGQTLVLGRAFTEQDRQDAPDVAIVNESFARYFFGNENPVGRKFDPAGGNRFTCEIVGVVQDASYLSVKDEAKRVFYVPYAQGPDFLLSENMILAVRSAAAGASLAREVRQAVAQRDKSILVETETLQNHIDGSLARDRLLAVLSGLLGAISLLLVAIGLYGVMAYSVLRRTGEIGIRMALGARPSAMLIMVLREGALLVLIGVFIGAVAALAATDVISSLLFGITARDTGAFAGAAAAMALAALLATLLPALRAARVDPMEALRAE
jgi:putative ABC transport system permease protein